MTERDRPAETVRVVTWNLWWRFGPWEARQPAIHDAVAAADADVLGLQETWSEQVDALAERGGYHTAYEPHHGHDFGNAVLSRWPISSTEVVPLPDEDDQGMPRDGVRSATVAEIDAPFGRLLVVSTHFAHRFDRSGLRCRQAGAIAELVAERRGDPEQAFPPVVLGDLNAVPESDEVRSLVGLSAPPVGGLIFTDAWAQVGEGPGHTWTPANPHQRDSAWPHRRLDYVLVGWPRPRPAGNPVAARLVGTDPSSSGIVPSDHYGVQVDLATG